MTLLALSLLALLSAPLLDRPLRTRARLGAGLDAFALVVIGGIVLVQVIPYGVYAAGWAAVAATVVGLAAPILSHRVREGRTILLVTTGLALFLHGVLDGAMLAEPGHDEVSELLAHAVLLHSLPVGLGVWRAVAPRHGGWAAMGVLVLSAVGEVLGWYGARGILAEPSPALAIAQCFAAGSLLHVLGHAREHRDAAGSAVGAVAGLAGVLFLAITHPPFGD